MHPPALPAQRHLPAILAASVPLAGWAATTTVLARRLDAARRDPLTGLMTRDAFTARATRLIARRPVLVVLVDLDGFKVLNDARGHAAGDAVLAHTAHRLAAAIGPTGAVGRFGGDEFTAALPIGPDIDHALTALSLLHSELTEPVPFGTDLLPVGASVGGHLAAPSTPLADALTAADAAMYAAKRGGGGWELSEHPARTYTAAPRRWRRHRPTTAERRAT
ncbi:GGDEF domain-containing protein [Streptacidiphilus sp. ASG 303]|uniref:GGDEF domain-containing protein n=1 Tax=Streptacidiphilus sp. ASG 303 TaxID=2896847 RepID=UPI001E29376C|nr:GGDEF domain-containing protein [Streptacidiphilus sp. ASG 303]MCD0483450.1 GGDEF domain-containing protein [Streptacidiphilus sp. ASG 303]